MSLVAAIGMIFGYKMHKSNPVGFIEQYADDDLSTVEETLRLIRSNYYGEIDTTDYFNEVLNSAVSHLDPYSSYIPPQDLAGFQHAISRTYVGYGFDFISYRDSMIVTEVIEASPAHRANLHRGDVIISLNGQQYSEPSEMIERFYHSDSATIDVYHPVTRHTEMISMVKADVAAKSVEPKILKQGEIGYLRINRFTDGVFLEFMEQFDYYKSQGLDLKKIIIDLRDNPGGLLDETVKILNQIIQEPNLIIVSTINNKGKQKDYKSNGRSFLNIEEVVVLINERSASASEILAGSLQDLGAATIIGSNSYGKGKIQQHFAIDNGGTLNLTVGEYLLPSGRRITSDSTDSLARGVVPDVAIESTCLRQSGQRLRSQYVYLIERKQLSQEVMNPAQINQLITDYLPSSNSSSANCSKEDIRLLATLLWHEYQSDLDLNEDLIIYDEALSQAIELLSN